MPGPLTGIKIIEMVGLGPCPFAAMMLADMGAEVIRIDRKTKPGADNPFPMLGTKFDVMARGRRSLALDLKQPAADEVVLKLAEQADILIEGFRPGVMERLGLGLDACQARNPGLVFGRITGWGQSGPLAHSAGHDLNYIALSGMLHAMGRAKTPPAPPLNLVGDFGGGAMMLAFGVVCAALLGAMVYGLRAFGSWSDAREANMLDGGAPFYDTYACRDGKFLSVGAIEPQFYAQLLAITGATDPDFAKQWSQKRWPALKTKFAALFATRTRDEWCTLLEGTDACVAPVLDMAEAPGHPHNVARSTFIEIDGVTQPAPAPRFSRTQAEAGRAAPAPGQHSAAVLADWGFDHASIETLKGAGVI